MKCILGKIYRKCILGRTYRWNAEYSVLARVFRNAYIFLQEVLRGWPTFWSFDPTKLQNGILYWIYSIIDIFLVFLRMLSMPFIVNKWDGRNARIKFHNFQGKTIQSQLESLFTILKKSPTFLLSGETKGQTGKGPQGLEIQLLSLSIRS